MTQALDRRMLLQMLGGVALVAATDSSFAQTPSQAQDGSRIARLLRDARGVEPISARIAFISRAFLGAGYRANTLIGGPAQREQFVVRADVFDCVTFCETVLAMARSRDYGEFEGALKTIRYANGAVRWDERNHYFSDWGRRAVEHDICKPVALPNSVTISKTVNWGNLGRRQVAMLCAPTESLLARPTGLATGDIIGFVSRRTNLDFFHTGLVILSAAGEPILRNASQSRGRVLDEPLSRFVAANRVQYATLLRPVEGRRA
jgi:hypothetical protein